MAEKQLELPMDKTIDVKKIARKGWETHVRVLPSGYQRVIATKQPSKKK